MANTQTQIDTLKNFWSGIGNQVSTDVYPAIIGLVDTSIGDRSAFESNYIFSTALLDEPNQQTTIEQWKIDPLLWSAINASLGHFWSPIAAHSPRWFMLDGITQALKPGFLGYKDPLGLASWIGSVSVSGGAINYTISSDPDPEVRAAALNLLKNVAFPIEWIKSIDLGLKGLDETLNAAPWDQQTRAVIAALSRDVRARLDLVANVTANGTDFSKLTAYQTPSGEPATMPPPPDRPWYKRIELYAGAIGGAIGGVKAAHQASKNK